MFKPLRKHEAQEKADAIVTRFRRITDKLRGWQSVCFKWRDAQGNKYGVPDDPEAIDLSEVPTIEQIRDAVTTAQAATENVKSQWGQLTQDEQQLLHHPGKTL